MPPPVHLGVGHGQQERRGRPLVGSYVVTYEAASPTWTNYAVDQRQRGLPRRPAAGNYKLLIQPNTAGYPDSWYGGSTFANATVVVVDGPKP